MVLPAIYFGVLQYGLPFISEKRVVAGLEQRSEPPAVFRLPGGEKTLGRFLNFHRSLVNGTAGAGTVYTSTCVTRTPDSHSSLLRLMLY